MALAEFKTIFWWEWAHRLLGRAIGVEETSTNLGVAMHRQLVEALRGERLVDAGRDAPV
jgi:heme A synthase